jgi:hypothetical protein
VFYSPGPYSPYLKINHNTRKFEPLDKYPSEPSPADHIVKVVRQEPYETDDITRSVLAAITKREKSRKKFESEQRKHQE